MSNSDENRILIALKQAKQQGQLRLEKIREIVKNAVAQTIAEEKEGRKEISSIMQDAVSATIETFQEKGGEIKEEITASIEGAIEGIESVKNQRFSQDRLKMQELESKIDADRAEVQQEINGALVQLKETQTGQSEKVKSSVEAAINSILNSEEVALLQKRYAQLKAQLAIVRANLSEKYGGNFKEIEHHLEDAKTWYEKAKQNPEVFTNKVDRQRIEFESKLGEAGVAIAQKEKQIKQILQELWKSALVLFQDKKSK
jgi:hypothetical protein